MDNTVRAKRRWWIAASLVLLTPVGFLYVGRPKLFFTFLLWKLAVFAILFIGAPAWFASPLAVLALGVIDGAVFVFTGVMTIWLSAVQKHYVLQWCNSWVAYAAGSSVVLALLVLPELPMFDQKVKTYTVSSSSMVPTLLTSDDVVADQRHSTTLAVRAGDVVGARYAHKGPAPYLHRIIGAPGDEIRLVNGIPEVNGVLLRQDKVPSIFVETEGVEVRREFLPSGRSY